MSYPQGMSIGLLKSLADMLRDDDDEMPTEHELTFDSTESDNDELNDDSVDSLKIPNYHFSYLITSTFSQEDISRFCSIISCLLSILFYQFSILSYLT